MEKLKFLIAFIMLFSINLSAQDKFISIVNSSVTALGSSATFTGKAEDVTDYGSIIVTHKSDKASATNGVKYQFSSDAINWDSYLIKTYAAADSLTNTTILPVKAKYFRIVYTNTTSNQTYFRLQTIFSKSVTAGVVEITGTVPLPTGASTEASLLVLLGYQHPFSISTGTLTTVSTEVDTTTFTSTVWQTFGAFAVDDTLEIALSGSFADSKIVYPYTAYTFEKFSPTTFSKGYIRRYGGAGTVSYIPTIKGY